MNSNIKKHWQVHILPFLLFPFHLTSTTLLAKIFVLRNPYYPAICGVKAHCDGLRSDQADSIINPRSLHPPKATVVYVMDHLGEGK